MNPLKELSLCVEKYFSTNDDDEKELLVKRTKEILYQIETKNFIKKCLEDRDDDFFMENIKPYIRMKEDDEKNKIVKEEGKIYLFI